MAGLVAQLDLRDQLLVAQAVYQHGNDAWGSVSTLLTAHPLITQSKEFFSPETCQSIYNDLMSQANLDPTALGHEQPSKLPNAKIHLKLAQKHYALRVKELKEMIASKEVEFHALVENMEQIRSGAYDQKLLEEVQAEHPVKEPPPLPAERIGEIMAKHPDIGKERDRIEINVTSLMPDLPPAPTSADADADQRMEVEHPPEMSRSLSGGSRSERSGSRKGTPGSEQADLNPKFILAEAAKVLTTVPWFTTDSRQRRIQKEKKALDDYNKKHDLPPVSLPDISSPTPSSAAASSPSNRTRRKRGLTADSTTSAPPDSPAPEGPSTTADEDETPSAPKASGTSEVDAPPLQPRDTKPPSSSDELSDAPSEVRLTKSPGDGTIDEDDQPEAEEQSVNEEPPHHMEEEASVEAELIAEDAEPLGVEDAIAEKQSLEDGMQLDKKQDIREVPTDTENQGTPLATDQEEPKPLIHSAIGTDEGDASDAHRAPTPERTGSMGSAHDETPAALTADTPASIAADTPANEPITRSGNIRGKSQRKAVPKGKRKATEVEGLSESSRDKKRARDVSEPAEIMDEDSNVTDPDKKKKQAANRIKQFTKLIDMLHTQISTHRSGNIFQQPIRKADAPDYFDIVKRPIDLKTIRARVRDGTISTSSQYIRDIYLMFANSLMYNRPGSDVHTMAYEMMIECEGYISRHKETEAWVSKDKKDNEKKEEP